MMKIAICDDEPYYRTTMKKAVSDYFAKWDIDAETDCFSSGEELLNQKEKLEQHNILFLDINLKELNGVETAKKIRKIAPQIYLVFVTAFISYSLEGYKVDAVRYILKEESTLQASIEEALDTIRKKERRMQTTSFPFLEGERSISLSEIAYIESSLHKLIFHIGTTGQCLTLYEKLDNVEPPFLEQGFLRTHKSFLVNPAYIGQIHHYTIYLTTGQELPVPKTKYRSVKEGYTRYEGEI